jgi:hypothetical protein
MSVGVSTSTTPFLEPAINRAAHTRWSVATCVAFRAWFIFVLFLVLPRGLDFFIDAGVWASIVNWVGRWPIVHILHLAEHHVAGPMTGADFLPDFIAAGVIGCVSVLVAIAWSLTPAGHHDHPVLFVWLYTLVRFLLGSLLLYYAWDKILPGQFGLGPDVTKVVRPVTALTPMELLWVFMSMSRPYVVFSGLAELTGGILLFTRRTTVLGAMISVCAMANVVMLNVAYDVSVKFLAALMFLMALSLLMPHMMRLGGIFLLHQSIGLAPLPPLFTSPRRDQVARVGGVFVAVVILGFTYKMAQNIVVLNTGVGLFSGVWELQSMERDGTTVSPVFTDGTLWRQLIFSGDDTGASAVTVSGAETPYRVSVDKNAALLTFTPRPFVAARASKIAFLFRLADADHLELRSRASASQSAQMTFRRVSEAEWPIVAHRHSWRW